MAAFGQDTLGTKRTLTVDGKDYSYFSLKAADGAVGNIARLPYALKILMENLLRFEDGETVTEDDIRALAAWADDPAQGKEIAYRPTRVLMQDFTGVPAVVDLAAMRDAMQSMGGDARAINPLNPVDLVIDHSVMVDQFGTPQAFQQNVEREMERNRERYQFLRWGQTAFDNFSVVPPGTGICHQVNLEYLGQVVWSRKDGGEDYAFPDTLVGTDSHTTMINGLGVLGWGVGGIEAEAAMLGQPVTMLIPEVVGFRLKGRLREGATATDLVLTCTEMLRKKGVVGKFVEFFGDGVGDLSVADRATISNMSPEFGATCAIFPVDQATIDYLAFTDRKEKRVKLVEAYAREQGLWREDGEAEPVFSDTLELDLSTVEPSLAGPKRPQDRISLSRAAEGFRKTLKDEFRVGETRPVKAEVPGEDYTLDHGDVVIAAITSCTNTSNPMVMIAAGLIARNALEKGLKVKPWVKTSLAPGSKVVTDYLEAADLQDDLDALGFNLVGYGCTTCIGNSGPLPPPISEAISENDLVCTSVLSGNRNFEGRISQDVKANYLASPPLVVAYALAGNMKIDIAKDPIGKDKDGKDIYLKDIWPSNKEVADVVHDVLSSDMFRTRYADVFTGPEEWRGLPVSEGLTYDWQEDSTYVRRPPFFEGLTPEPEAVRDVEGAHVLVLLGDSITTDHISPAGAIKIDSPAGEYLQRHGVKPRDFNSYGARRGNHEVMMRGTFANIRLKNRMTPGKEGSWTRFIPTGEEMSIYDAAMRYAETETPLVVLAGKEYGTGSSRDWAAKGTRLLGVRAVIAESYERIHRSNLIGMGVLPLQFADGEGWEELGLAGTETVDIRGLDSLEPGGEVTVTIKGDKNQTITALCRIDTANEMQYYLNGGILHYVLRRLARGE